MSPALSIINLELQVINEHTEEDQHWHIDKWATLFKATTWEEVKMIAQRDDSILSAANTIWKLTQEEKIRQQSEAGRITAFGSWMCSTRLTR